MIDSSLSDGSGGDNNIGKTPGKRSSERISREFLVTDGMYEADGDEPYFVEVDTNGCGKCGARRTWMVVGPDGYSGGPSYSDYRDAAMLAYALNDAYGRGKRSLMEPHAR